VIAVSQAVADSLQQSGVIESSKITVVHNGIDTDRFGRWDETAGKRGDDSSAQRGDELSMLIGTVGHLAPIKGQDVFLRAAALISARRRDVQFVIVGEDKSSEKNYRTFLENLVSELGLNGSVTMPGWQDDISRLLSSLTLFVSAARSEPFGLSIVEAMATGLPVIASASEGASEIIEDGRTGKLVPLDDADALAEAITQLLDNPTERSRLGHNAQLTARQCYSLTRMAIDTERVYREVLAG
jgi:glycosyltransferase involved in cell wall biosynthesis